jgi:hypothetical protein
MSAKLAIDICQVIPKSTNSKPPCVQTTSATLARSVAPYNHTTNELPHQQLDEKE